MSKCLVVRNADFSVNKITTVVFDDVPCTGVSLSQNSLSFSSLASATLTATVTPSNTTDELVWATTDNSVATVSSGVVTPVGIGECTISVTCGMYSATCSVSVDIVENPFLALATFATPFTVDEITYNLLTVSNRIGCVCLLADSSFSNKISIYNQSTAFEHGDVTAIKIPNNAAYVHISASGLYGSDSSIVFFDATVSAMNQSNYYGLKVISSSDLTVASGSVDQSIAIPAGANSYIVSLRASSSSIFSSVSSEDDMVSIYENTLNAEITYETDAD